MSLSKLEMLSETTEELKTSDLVNYMYPFNLSENGEFNGSTLPSFVAIIHRILSNHEEEQEKN